MGRSLVATYSIVACDLDAGQWGVAVQSKFLAVGSVVPWAEPHVGAIATQSYANPRYGPDGLALLREGRPAEEVVSTLTAADEGRAQRQVGVVDGAGRAATFTGEECHDWAGGRTGDGYAAQGNILVSAATVDALATTFEQNGHLELVERLVECLAAAQAAGGDRRGQQSASLLVVHQEIFGVTPREDWLSVDEALARELGDRLAKLGYDGALDKAFFDWAGTENLEERVDGVGEIDPVVLEALRKQSA